MVQTHTYHKTYAVARRLQRPVRCPRPARDGPHRCGPPPRSRHDVSHAAKEPGRGASAETQPRPTRARRSLASAPRRGPLTLGLHEHYRAHLTPKLRRGPHRTTPRRPLMPTVARRLERFVRCPRPAPAGSPARRLPPRRRPRLVRPGREPGRSASAPTGPEPTRGLASLASAPRRGLSIWVCASGIAHT